MHRISFFIILGLLISITFLYEELRFHEWLFDSFFLGRLTEIWLTKCWLLLKDLLSKERKVCLIPGKIN